MLRTREAPAALPTGRDGPAIEVRGLVMRYGDREVLHGIDLAVPHGMVPSEPSATDLTWPTAMSALSWE